MKRLSRINTTLLALLAGFAQGIAQQPARPGGGAKPPAPVPGAAPALPVYGPTQVGRVIPAPARPPTRVAPRLIGTPASTTPVDALAFDAEVKERMAEPGATHVQYTFYLTNRASVEVSIHNVHTSCGCTVAKLPAQPWVIAPGGSGPIDVALDLRGKRGVLTKSITIQSSSGVKHLTIRATIPDASGFVAAAAGGMLDADRVQNIQKALVDRQIVFKDRSCAECHAAKAVGRVGRELYDVACGICHDAPHRATMVTDLKQRNPGMPEAWRQWIQYGKTNTLMPAFAQSAGGILSDEQIESLVRYVTEHVPPGTEYSGPASVPAGVSPHYRTGPGPLATPSDRPVKTARHPLVQRPAAVVPLAAAPAPPQPSPPPPPATPINPVPFPED